jgi:hypothetical protein
MRRKAEARPRKLLKTTISMKKKNRDNLKMKVIEMRKTMMEVRMMTMKENLIFMRH